MADSISAIPQQPQLGAVARGVRSLQELAGQYQVSPWVPLLGGTSVDELFGLPGAARELENWSYGNAPLRINPYAGRTASFVPEVKPGRAKDLADVLFLGADATGLASPIGRAVARTTPAKALDRMVREGYERGLIPAPGMVVKPKGGNWLSGSIENLGNEYKLKETQVPFIGQDPSNRLRAMEISLAQNIEAGVPVDLGFVESERARLARDMAVNRWIDTKLNKYIRNEMGTPEDPVRKLAEEGKLHYNPQHVGYHSTLDHIQRGMAREEGGFPKEGMGVSDLARRWEDLADISIRQRSAAEIQNIAERGAWENDRLGAQEILNRNPWLKDAPGLTKVYSVSPNAYSQDALGIPHLIDELRAAVDPASDLPAHLRLTPEKLDKVTMPQAVELVAKINKYRAEEAAKAEKAGMLANLQGAPRVQDPGLSLSFTEKPGGTWVDLPEATKGKDLDFCTTIGKQGGWCTQHPASAQSYGSRDSRLAVLLDAEGRPHVQAQIKDSIFDASKTELGQYLSADEAVEEQFYRNVATLLRERGVENADQIAESLSGGLRDRMPANIRDMLPEIERAAEAMLPKKEIPLPDIVQLKPPNNTFEGATSQEYIRRDPEYKRKISESVVNFLNSGSWGKVNDLHHFSIVDASDPKSLWPAMERLYGEEKTAKVPQSAIDAFNLMVDSTPDAPRFFTTRQLRDALEPFNPLGEIQDFAGGGLVSIARKYFSTAAKEASKEQKMLQGVYRGYAGESGGEKELFASPQRRVADYYAEKRAAQTGEEPHVEMLLIDPEAGKTYGHATAGTKANPPMTTRAKKLSEEDIEERTVLKATGGLVEYDPERIDRMAAELLSQEFVAVGDKQPTPAPVRPEELQLREGATSARLVRAPQGYNARLAADVAPGVQPFVDVDPFKRLITQYGLQYASPLPGGGVNAEFVVDPVNNARVLSGALRQQLGKDSEISARGAYVSGAEKPSYNVGVQYKRRFADGGLVQFDANKVEQLANSLLEDMYA